ncbi:hypothetical protein [Saccharopolyspora erythraea]|uniref:hypothetical protein n=1 Tax=Saccharopolyspora erythraea TaxID=1836 RepID=UPI000322DFD5|nr:hypothetical protein [Saccharopolyspora erythraea]
MFPHQGEFDLELDRISAGTALGCAASDLIEGHSRQYDHRVGGCGVKFDMGSSTLSTLTKQTQGSSDDLGALIRQLIAAAEPLQGKFNGAGRAAFDGFKTRADEITAELNSSLAAILGGQSGMDSSFGQGDTEMADNATSAQGSANFDAARFGAR